MRKVVILGCENSHANNFLKFIKEEEKFSDVEVIGVYSHVREASEKLSEEFGVKVMDNYDEAVGKVDGVIITARHGDNHFKYAKPYISSGVPMFIDKPITISEEEAIEFMRLCRDNGVRITGGSCLKFADVVQDVKKAYLEERDGKTLGAFFRAPVNLNNEHGGFFFYSQHLTEMVMEVFGPYPKSVHSFVNGKKINTVISYPDFDVTALHTDGSYVYYATRHAEKGVAGGVVDLGTDCFLKEFDEFYELLCGGEQKISYEDFIAPVFVLNAIYRSMNSGEKVEIKEYKL